MTTPPAAPPGSRSVNRGRDRALLITSRRGRGKTIQQSHGVPATTPALADRPGIKSTLVTDILDAVRRAARKKLLFLSHAISQMARRGPSCLMLGSGEGRAVHVVCAPKDEYLAVITAYVPDPSQWSPDSRRRMP